MARQQFMCAACGLRVTGRIDKTIGLIYPYDRAATVSSEAPLPCICLDCAKTETRALDWTLGEALAREQQQKEGGTQ